MKRRVYLIGDWLAVVGWLFVIFYFSSQPDLRSGLPSLWDTVFRKIAHISEYFVLSYLLIRTWRDLGKNQALFISLILTIGVAILDEYYQSFVAGRVGSVYDVLIDGAGALAAVGLVAIYGKHLFNQ